jgi:hypothetical protein
MLKRSVTSFNRCASHPRHFRLLIEAQAVIGLVAVPPPRLPHAVLIAAQATRGRKVS